MTIMEKVFASWSGGKDSCFACYRAITGGLDVRCLLNMVTGDGKRSWTHGLSAEILQMQSQAVGIPLVQRRTTRSDYETDFKNALLDFKSEGVSGGIFGDIDLDVHRQWIEKVCASVGITPHLPLWMVSQDGIMRDFVAAGFEAVVVAAKAELFSEEWVGRRVDMDFISQLNEKDITPCGESGEYHTVVLDGPMFRQRLEIVEAEKVLRDEHWFLDIKKCVLTPK